MALFKFTKAILTDKPIQVFNYGKHRRDFTYIDDIVEGVIRVLDKPPTKINNKLTNSQNQSLVTDHQPPYSVYNIGNNNPVYLMDYIESLEKALGKTAKKEFLPLQPGDIPDTNADISDLVVNFQYKPSTTINEGIHRFVSWYREYNKY